MQSKVKLSKRQIKEDKFTTFVLTSKQRVIDNWQFLVIGVVVVVLVVAGIVYFVNSRSTWQAEAGQRFAQAMMEYRNGDRQIAVTSFEQVLDDYGSHVVAEEATYMLGSVNFELKNYSEAIRYWEMYLSKYQEDQLKRAAAQAGIASAYENQGDYTQAAEWFEKAVEGFPEGPLVPDYYFGAMRCYVLAGNMEAARAKLDTIAEQFEGSDIHNRAARYFAEHAYSGRAIP